MWKTFFYFSKRERQGIVLLAVLIAGVLLGKWFFRVPPAEVLEESQDVEVLNGDDGKPTGTYVPLPQRDAPRDAPPRVSQERGLRDKPAPVKTRTFYARDRDTIVRPAPRADVPRQDKFAKGETLQLNAADTLELKKIPGVGSSFAKRIVAYRNILGGYHRVEQLQEVYGMYVELFEQIAPYIRVDDTDIVRIQVNKAGIDKLRNHPYLNFYQAKAIIETRKKLGTLQGISDLQLLEEFTADDWTRVAPYLDFQ
ncbi:hypothetical protein AGMMS4957_06650 [Bacteroidia bacterium]|nr:hypothetical protein AGMMS4957_06650 [Bacteroidia bacterium]